MASAELFNKELINERSLNKGKGDTTIKLYIELPAMFLILFKGFDSTLLFNSKSKK